MFRWDKNPDTMDGGLVRILVGKLNWRKVFAEFGKTQRRYDPVHDEIDLCAALDPAGTPEDDMDYWMPRDTADALDPPVGGHLSPAHGGSSADAEM